MRFSVIRGVVKKNDLQDAGRSEWNIFTSSQWGNSFFCYWFIVVVKRGRPTPGRWNISLFIRSRTDTETLFFSVFFFCLLFLDFHSFFLSPKFVPVDGRTWRSWDSALTQSLKAKERMLRSSVSFDFVRPPIASLPIGSRRNRNSALAPKSLHSWKIFLFCFWKKTTWSDPTQNVSTVSFFFFFFIIRIFFLLAAFSGHESRPITALNGITTLWHRKWQWFWGRQSIVEPVNECWNAVRRWKKKKQRKLQLDAAIQWAVRRTNQRPRIFFLKNRAKETQV